MYSRRALVDRNTSESELWEIYRRFGPSAWTVYQRSLTNESYVWDLEFTVAGLTQGQLTDALRHAMLQTAAKESPCDMLFVVCPSSDKKRHLRTVHLASRVIATVLYRHAAAAPVKLDDFIELYETFLSRSETRRDAGLLLELRMQDILPRAGIFELQRLRRHSAPKFYHYKLPRKTARNWRSPAQTSNDSIARQLKFPRTGLI